jgi:hypothetical protein
MAKPKPDGLAAVQAAALSVEERMLLFCISSKTEWERGLGFSFTPYVLDQDWLSGTKSARTPNLGAQIG